MFEGLSLTAIMPIVTALGLPGLVLVFWFVDHRRYDEERKASEKRFEAVVRMYEDNILLVKGYERLAGDLANIIHLNTQMQTRLAEKIENNMNCPIVRDGGFGKWALTANG